MKKILSLAFCCMFSVMAFAKTNNNIAISKLHKQTANILKLKAKPVASTKKSAFFDCTATSSVTCGDITVTYEVTAASCEQAGGVAGHLADITTCG
jgi:hypothetical protein